MPSTSRCRRSTSPAGRSCCSTTSRAAAQIIDDARGHTVAAAARLLHAAGAASVDLAVTHALFAGDALALIRAAGVREVWSTDAIAHPSNAVSVAPLIAQALGRLAKP
ncbi:MAG TPA: hypothetical protein PL143_06970 [Rhodocyclaceae bacterium]|nr:hypothetical protein [Rhodocyclaceae bacterium]